MERSWMKTLAIGLLCCLLIVCTDGADQSVTVDDIIRSVTAVRAQIGMALKDRIAQQTAGNRIAPVRPPNTASGRVPGLTILFRGVPNRNRTTTNKFNGYLPPLEVSTLGTTTITPSSSTGMVSSEGFSTSTRPPVDPEESPDPTSALRANPLGFIFPSQQQLDHFNSQFARPWTGDGGALKSGQSTTTPRVVDFVFPTDDTDDVAGPPVTRRPSIATGVTEPSDTVRIGTSSTSSPEPHIPEVATEGIISGSSLGTTEDTVEEETTEPEGLGNRIDQKVLLSLVG
ncbi:uncharacterized protein LOC126581784 [Anopheles aquasalis]|uniref:uncharacterized protein LOC126581784 n=1 Tax=Anopheles aquasalis TaxID=42839 RepID=UPI00215A538A|nr:uncharacterized protein LOC126581784 [Anopheles aquasalis]